MGKDTGFIEVRRKDPEKLGVRERLTHYREIYREMAEDELRRQASRCMDCGIPFCHGFGCPLGNLIPEWNDLVYRGRWREASELLHSTNNFPELTGRVCPAPCEPACTLRINDEPVTIRQLELAVVERAFHEGWIVPERPQQQARTSVAVVGSGPAGMAAAQQLRRAGHAVTLFEKEDRPGGILRYGIPDFKLEKQVLDRRFRQMEAEGLTIETNVDVGNDISAGYLRKRFDAVCLCVGAGQPRDLPLPGRHLGGIHFAMPYLTQQNRRVGWLQPAEEEILARGKRVVVLGGGDTGADCVGTALRQGAASVEQLEVLPQPPEGRNPATPWPQWPNVLRNSTSHEEGGRRRWAVCTKQFLGHNGQVVGLRAVDVEWSPPDRSGRRHMQEKRGTEFELEAELVLLATGFVRPVHQGLLDDLGVEYDARGNVKVTPDCASSVAGVFAAGDATTGAWLVVHAIAAGRRMARAVDMYLTGDSCLPEPPPAASR